MEKELFFTGYCRMLDGSRTVEVIVTDGRAAEADCRYGSCVYEPDCPIARRIRESVVE